MQRTRQYVLLIVVAFIISLSIGGLQGVFHQQIPAQNNIAKPKSESFPTPVGEWDFNGNGVDDEGGSTAIATGSGAFFYSSGGLNGGYAHLTTMADSFSIADLPAYELAQNFTVSFWYRQQTGVYTQNQHFVTKGSQPYPTFQIFQLQPGPTNDFREAYCDSIGDGYVLQNNVHPAYGQWHYVVFMKNTTEEWGYIDAQLINSQPISADAKVTTDPIVLGSCNNTDFDQLELYNTTLAYSDILTEYHQYFPTVSFTISATPFYANYAAFFNASAAGGVAPYNYLWDFGDGTGLTAGIQPIHTYSNAGNYLVNCTVTDFQGNSYSSIQNVNVVTDVMAEFTVNSTNFNAPGWIICNDFSMGGVSPYTFLWNFGDGQNSTFEYPSHEYLAAGNFNLTLTTTDFNNYSNTNWEIITVNQPIIYYPIVQFTMNATTIYIGQSVQFTDTSYNGTQPYNYTWEFGDGSFSHLQNPIHTFDGSAGLYTVTLMVNDSNGKSNSQSQVIYVVNQNTGTTTNPNTGKNSSSTSSTSNQNPFPNIEGFPLETVITITMAAIGIAIWKLKKMHREMI